MKKQYAYLVSDGKRVFLTLNKPDDIDFDERKWSLRGFSFKIGEAVTVYTDNIWEGTVGVYDISIPNHIECLAKDMREHTLALACRRMEDEIHQAFGGDVSDEVRCSIWSKPESKLGGLLWDVIQTLKKIGFQEK